MIALHRPKPEPARPVLDPATMVVCCEAFRRGAVAEIIEKGQWLRLDSATVQAFKQYFAVRLSDLELHE